MKLIGLCERGRENRRERGSSWRCLLASSFLLLTEPDSARGCGNRGLWTPHDPAPPFAASLSCAAPTPDPPSSPFPLTSSSCSSRPSPPLPSLTARAAARSRCPVPSLGPWNVSCWGEGGGGRMNNNCMRECTVGGGMGLPSIVGRGQRHRKCGTPCPTMHRAEVLPGGQRFVSRSEPGG